MRLSIHPPTHTPHMFSWFPIFFPLREPVPLDAGQPLEAHMWRCTAHHKVGLLLSWLGSCLFWYRCELLSYSFAQRLHLLCQCF